MRGEQLPLSGAKRGEDDRRHLGVAACVPCAQLAAHMAAPLQLLAVHVHRLGHVDGQEAEQSSHGADELHAPPGLSELMRAVAELQAVQTLLCEAAAERVRQP